jgi:3-oxoacyl-[acyl-carrier protein] reductase
MKLEGKVVLVTGGSRGIGRAIALACAREGANLSLCARTESEVDKTVAELRGLGVQCAGQVCDVSQEESVEQLIASVMDRFGRIDVLVNNAGVMTRASTAWELDVRKWDYTIAVNLRGAFLVSRAVLPYMIRQKGGSIINVSSMIGRMAYPNFIAYSASKWGLEGFSQALAAELRSHRIRVNSVDPGTVATKLTGFSGSKPESVTGVFVFLASDESKGITGRMLSSSNWRSEIR